MQSNLPILYTFIRCPWAMRARLALHFMQVPFTPREVNLRDKPQALLDISPKATVPVLLLPDGKVIDESLDIIYWSMPEPSVSQKHLIDELVGINDNDFKYHNARYKYPDRYPEDQETEIFHRQECEKFIQQLDSMLAIHEFVLDDKETIADFAIFPMIRQFSKVVPEWWDSAEYPHVKRWLDSICAKDYYIKTMEKLPVWQ